MKFDEEVAIIGRGQAFPQFYGNAIPYGDKHCPWNPMDFNYRFWMHMASCEIGYLPGVTHDQAIEILMMGGEL